MRQGSVKVIALSALCLCLLAACGRDQGQSATIFAMDTVMELTAYGSDAEEALTAATAEVNTLDALLSVGKETSDIARLNRAQGEPVSVSDQTAQLLTEALAVCQDVDGALDVSIYPAMRAWGFDSKDYRVPEQDELSDLLERVDYAAISVKGDTITVPAGMGLDLGAVGKGYAADQIVAIWREMGLTSGLLNLGGNVQCLGARPDGTDWTVAIRDPDDETEILATVSGQDMAVVTSGSYQRYFEKDGQIYHHILDPETCAPARGGARSVTVIGSSGLVCDALSTALFVMGPREAAEYWQERHDFDFIYYTEEGTLWYTSGLKGRITLREGLEGQMRTWKSASL